MDLVDLVILACLAANPGVCTQRHLAIQWQGSLADCSIHAEPTLARWIDAHPKLRIARWRCLWPEMEDQRS